MNDFSHFIEHNQTIIIEALGFIAMIVGILSFVSSKQNNTRSILGVSAIFWTLHYYMLSAYTTAGTQLVLVARNFLSIFIKSTRVKHIVFWIAVILITGLCVITWQGWKSVIPLAAGLNSTYALCYLGNKRMRQMMVLTSLLWMINGIIWNSWAQVAAEIIKMGINLLVSNRITGDINAEDAPTEIVTKENVVQVPYVTLSEDDKVIKN